MLIYLVAGKRAILLIEKYQELVPCSLPIREFTKLRLLLWRKLHIKIVLCARLSVLQLFHVGHEVQSNRSKLICLPKILFLILRQRRKDLMLRLGVVVRTSNINISRLRSAAYVRAARAARLFFFIQPIKSLPFGVVVAVFVAIS